MASLYFLIFFSFSSAFVERQIYKGKVYVSCCAAEKSLIIPNSFSCRVEKVCLVIIMLKCIQSKFQIQKLLLPAAKKVAKESPASVQLKRNLQNIIYESEQRPRFISHSQEEQKWNQFRFEWEFMVINFFKCRICCLRLESQNINLLLLARVKEAHTELCRSNQLGIMMWSKVRGDSKSI